MGSAYSSFIDRSKCTNCATFEKWPVLAVAAAACKAYSLCFMQAPGIVAAGRQTNNDPHSEEVDLSGDTTLLNMLRQSRLDQGIKLFNLRDLYITRIQFHDLFVDQSYINPVLAASIMTPMKTKEQLMAEAEKEKAQAEANKNASDEGKEEDKSELFAQREREEEATAAVLAFKGLRDDMFDYFIETSMIPPQDHLRNSRGEALNTSKMGQLGRQAASSVTDATTRIRALDVILVLSLMAQGPLINRLCLLFHLFSDDFHWAMGSLLSWPWIRVADPFDAIESMHTTVTVEQMTDMFLSLGTAMRRVGITVADTPFSLRDPEAAQMSLPKLPGIVGDSLSPSSRASKRLRMAAEAVRQAAKAGILPAMLSGGTPLGPRSLPGTSHGRRGSVSSHNSGIRDMSGLVAAAKARAALEELKKLGEEAATEREAAALEVKESELGGGGGAAEGKEGHGTVVTMPHGNPVRAVSPGATGGSGGGEGGERPHSAGSTKSGLSTGTSGRLAAAAALRSIKASGTGGGMGGAAGGEIIPANDSLYGRIIKLRGLTSNGMDDDAPGSASFVVVRRVIEADDAAAAAMGGFALPAGRVSFRLGGSTRNLLTAMEAAGYAMPSVAGLAPRTRLGSAGVAEELEAGGATGSPLLRRTSGGVPGGAAAAAAAAGGAAAPAVPSLQLGAAGLKDKGGEALESMASYRMGGMSGAPTGLLGRAAPKETAAAAAAGAGAGGDGEEDGDAGRLSDLGWCLGLATSMMEAPEKWRKLPLARRKALASIPSGRTVRSAVILWDHYLYAESHVAALGSEVLREVEDANRFIKAAEAVGLDSSTYSYLASGGVEGGAANNPPSGSPLMRRRASSDAGGTPVGGGGGGGAAGSETPQMRPAASPQGRLARASSMAGSELAAAEGSFGPRSRGALSLAQQVDEAQMRAAKEAVLRYDTLVTSRVTAGLFLDWVATHPVARYIVRQLGYPCGKVATYDAFMTEVLPAAARHKTSNKNQSQLSRAETTRTLTKLIIQTGLRIPDLRNLRSEFIRITDNGYSVNFDQFRKLVYNYLTNLIERRKEEHLLAAYKRSAGMVCADPLPIPAIASMPENARKRLIQKLFMCFDVNGDGTVDIAEFSVGISRVMHGKASDKLSFIFDVYDADGDGDVVLMELTSILMAVANLADTGSTNSKAAKQMDEMEKKQEDINFARELADALDLNGDGSITREEFFLVLEREPLLYECFAASLNLPLRGFASESEESDIEEVRKTGPVFDFQMLRVIRDTYSIDVMKGRAAQGGNKGKKKKKDDDDDMDGAVGGGEDEASKAETESKDGGEGGAKKKDRSTILERAVDRHYFRRLLRDVWGCPEDALFLVDRVFEYMDEDGSGSIDVRELYEGITKALRGSLLERADFFYSLFDMAGTGHLESQDILRILLASSGGDNVSEDDAKRVLEKLDADGSGTVEREEFLEAVEADPSVLDSLSRVFGRTGGKLNLLGGDADKEEEEEEGSDEEEGGAAAAAAAGSAEGDGSAGSGGAGGLTGDSFAPAYTGPLMLSSKAKPTAVKAAAAAQAGGASGDAAAAAGGQNPSALPPSGAPIIHASAPKPRRRQTLMPGAGANATAAAASAAAAHQASQLLQGHGIVSPFTVQSGSPSTRTGFGPPLLITGQTGDAAVQGGSVLSVSAALGLISERAKTPDSRGGAAAAGRSGPTIHSLHASGAGAAGGAAGDSSPQKVVVSTSRAPAGLQNAASKHHERGGSPGKDKGKEEKAGAGAKTGSGKAGAGGGGGAASPGRSSSPLPNLQVETAPVGAPVPLDRQKKADFFEQMAGRMQRMDEAIAESSSRLEKMLKGEELPLYQGTTAFLGNSAEDKRAKAKSKNGDSAGKRKGGRGSASLSPGPRKGSAALEAAKAGAAGAAGGGNKEKGIALQSRSLSPKRGGAGGAFLSDGESVASSQDGGARGDGKKKKKKKKRQLFIHDSATGAGRWYQRSAANSKLLQDTKASASKLLINSNTVRHERFKLIDTERNILGQVMDIAQQIKAREAQEKREAEEKQAMMAAAMSPGGGSLREKSMEESIAETEKTLAAEKEEQDKRDAEHAALAAALANMRAAGNKSSTKSSSGRSRSPGVRSPRAKALQALAELSVPLELLDSQQARGALFGGGGASALLSRGASPIASPTRPSASAPGTPAGPASFPEGSWKGDRWYPAAPGAAASPGPLATAGAGASHIPLTVRLLGGQMAAPIAGLTASPSSPLRAGSSLALPSSGSAIVQNTLGGRAGLGGAGAGGAAAGVGMSYVNALGSQSMFLPPTLAALAGGGAGGGQTAGSPQRQLHSLASGSAMLPPRASPSAALSSHASPSRASALFEGQGSAVTTGAGGEGSLATLGTRPSLMPKANYGPGGSILHSLSSPSHGGGGGSHSKAPFSPASASHSPFHASSLGGAGSEKGLFSPSSLLSTAPSKKMAGSTASILAQATAAAGGGGGGGGGSAGALKHSGSLVLSSNNNNNNMSR